MTKRNFPEREGFLWFFLPQDEQNLLTSQKTNCTLAAETTFFWFYQNVLTKRNFHDRESFLFFFFAKTSKIYSGKFDGKNQQVVILGRKPLFSRFHSIFLTKMDPRGTFSSTFFATTRVGLAQKVWFLAAWFYEMFLTKRVKTFNSFAFGENEETAKGVETFLGDWEILTRFLKNYVLFEDLWKTKARVLQHSSKIWKVTRVK